MKKSLKIGLITGASILTIGGTRAGLTKVGIIPNWLDLEILCPNKVNKGNNSDKFLDEMTNGFESKMNNLQPGENCRSECEAICDEYPRVMACENNCVDNCLFPNYNRDADDDNEKCDENGCRMEMNPSMFYVDKPIIYLYPIEETEVTVNLGNPEKLSHTYPKYNSTEGRNVIAQPNGDLKNIKTGRKLYALYREGIADNKPEFTEGFVVKGEDIITFLEEKLAILGLNEREAEEFIVYWLPQMENNPYNLIRFETIEEQNEAMPLNITPTPDTAIRVMMDWKSIESPIDISEQELTTPERKGFTVLEWGGSMLN